MPEGPEVKRITDWLNRKFKNKNLISVLIKKGRYIKHGHREREKNWCKN